MTGFLRAAAYLVGLGLVAFLIGRLLPKRWFDGDKFPYRDWPFEQKGNLYRKIGIHKWQSHVPDMSRLFKRMMPAKRLSTDVTSEQMERMVQETCVAEFTHLVLCPLSLPVLWLWPGPGGVIFLIMDLILGNLVFILVQRFNRPKLRQLRDRLRRKEQAGKQ